MTERIAGSGMAFVACRGGYSILAPDDSHAGMLAARRALADGAEVDASHGGDVVMFEDYWRWMRTGRYMFLLMECDAALLFIEMRPSLADEINWSEKWTVRHRTPHFICHLFSSADATCNEWVDLEVELERMPMDWKDGGEGFGAWIDRVCNRWTNRTCGRETYLRVYGSGDHHSGATPEYDESAALAGSVDSADRLLAASGYFIDQRTMERLAEDDDPVVRMALARNCRVCFPGVLDRLSSDPDWRVRKALCQNGGVYINYTGFFNDIGRRIDREWQAHVMIRLADDPEYEVRLAAAEVVAHSRKDGFMRERCVRAVLDSRHDDDFKADFSTMILEE